MDDPHKNIEESLLGYDLLCVSAHVRMLGETKICDKQTVKVVLDALSQLQDLVRQGQSYVLAGDADIHAAMERRLREMVGESASIVSIAKSRNDQIATDIRLWLRDALSEILAKLIELREALVTLSKRDMDVIMPGYTHMQPAQPILVSHWWLAYESRFKRDFDRLMDYFPRLNVLPLGACILAGTTEPIDRKLVAEYLAFDDVIENSIDAIFDRDFVIEFASLAALQGLHISQLSEELLLFATREFGFIKLPRSLTSGTNKLPFKRNPELLEVLRSRPSVFHGRLVEFMSQLKALPSGYSQDLQECLPGLMDVVENLKFALELTATLLGSVAIDAARMKEVACTDFPNWSNAVDYLVNRGVNEEQAQKAMEALLHYCQTRNKFFSDLALSEWQQFSPVFENDVYDYVTVEESVGAFCSFGSSSRDQVEQSLSRADGALEADRQKLKARAKLAMATTNSMESRKA